MASYSEIFASAIAEELRAQKARRKVSDEQIAQSVGIHRVSVSRYLSGDRPIPMMTFADLCSFLQISPTAVIDKAEQQARRHLQA